MKIIAVEEHVNENDLTQFDTRLKDMDEAGIDMQVLSYPFFYDESKDPSESTSAANSVNNKLARVVEKYPDRFAAFAAISLQDPESAAIELNGQ